MRLKSTRRIRIIRKRHYPWGVMIFDYARLVPASTVGKKSNKKKSRKAKKVVVI